MFEQARESDLEAAASALALIGGLYSIGLGLGRPVTTSAGALRAAAEFR